MKKQEPIMKIGSFGTHIIKAPSGRFIFVGTVPTDFSVASFETEDIALSCFVDWFQSLNTTDQRHYIGSLRNDIFERVING